MRELEGRRPASAKDETLRAMRLVLCAAVLAASVMFAASASGAPKLVLTSTAFPAGGMIPARFTCDGANSIVPLKWSGAPVGTKSFALIVDDPDAGERDVPPPDRVGHPRDGAKGLAGRAPIEGANGAGQAGWTGPCPPSGTHRYVFRLYAAEEQAAAEGGRRSDSLRGGAEGPGAGGREADRALQPRLTVRRLGPRSGSVGVPSPGSLPGQVSVVGDIDAGQIGHRVQVVVAGDLTLRVAHPQCCHGGIALERSSGNPGRDGGLSGNRGGKTPEEPDDGDDEQGNEEQKKDRMQRPVPPAVVVVTLAAVERPVESKIVARSLLHRDHSRVVGRLPGFKQRNL